MCREGELLAVREVEMGKRCDRPVWGGRSQWSTVLHASKRIENGLDLNVRGANAAGCTKTAEPSAQSKGCRKVIGVAKTDATSH
jgi:hypothetical protein